MEINKQLLSKIFSTYVGSKCKYVGERVWTREIAGDLIHILRGVNVKENKNFMESDMGLIVDYFTDSHKLILCPLPEITDTDAVQVAILASKAVFEQDIFHGKAIVLDIHKNKPITTLHPKTIISIIDFLRLREYDCGYGEIPSLIDAGIAVRNTDVSWVGYKPHS